jgi:phosphatidylserine decarboxylase
MRIATEGFPFIIVPFVIGAALVVVQREAALGIGFAVAGVVLLVVAMFCLFFFRDPDIAVATGASHVLSPCNGTVLRVDTDANGGGVVRVFLSIFSVHLQRSPVAGVVQSVEHKAGKFLMAMRPEAHDVNEQNIITVKTSRGNFVIKQVAGFLARRCVAWVKAGDNVEQGEKIGLIKFSSQVDLYVPNGVTIVVKAGDKVVAGVSVLGVWKEQGEGNAQI